MPGSVPDTVPLKVGLVEDDRRSRELLVYLLDGMPDYEVVGDWPSVERLLATPPTEAPDVLLLDIELPGMSGVEGLTPLRRRYPEMTVLMLTVFEDEEKVFDALCNGAHGYLLKNTPPSRLLESVREAHGGGSPMSPEIARKVVRLFRRTAAPRRDEVPSLSPQQVRLLSLLADGHSYQTAGDEMNVSINTIRTYIRTIYEKLHVHSRSAAVARALRSGLI